LGKGGKGLPDGSPELAALGATWGPHQFQKRPVCDVCWKAGRADTIEAAIGDVPSSAVDALLEAMVNSGAEPFAPEDEEAVTKASAGGKWRLGVLNMSRPSDYSSLPFGTLEVPVRLRTPTQDPTLSTGEWNRWLRSEVGDRCDGLCKAQATVRPPFILLLPYVVDKDSTPPKRWGAIIQIHGRSARGTQLISRPSKR